MSGFKKATREQRPLRMALYGPSGSGKTFTSLMIARELVGPDGTIALIDTERSSASIYAKNLRTGKGYDFDTASLTDYSHSDYIALIEQASEHDALIIDSISPAWEGKGGILDLHSIVVAGQKKKDSFAAWGDERIKKAERALWDTVLEFNGHVFVTMRAKTTYERSTDDRGKAKIEKLGLEPKQRSGIEFDFDVIAEMDKNHWLEIDKARDPEGELDGSRIHKPGIEFAQKLKQWLDSGSTPTQDYERRITVVCEEIAGLMHEEVASVKLKAWKWIQLQFDINTKEEMATISNEDLATIPEKLLANFGPGAEEDQRQMRQGEVKA